MTSVETQTQNADIQVLADADVDQVSGGLFFLIVAAVALVAAESCVRDKRAH